MVERPELAAAWRLLEQLDASLLRDCDCWFGGGTAISLRCGEFRLSRDVDFLCASRAGYQRLRKQIFDRGARSLFLTPVDIVREARVDRYGIRLALRVGEQVIKLEIVSEGRIDLEGIDESSLPVARLRDDDMVAEKLLANADRYLDDASMGRDAIDLILLEATINELPATGWAKAHEAYGDVVDVAWERALRRLRKRPAMREQWFDQMSVLPWAREQVEARLSRLPPDDEDE